MSARKHLLLAISHEVPACALVDYAADVCRGTGSSWSVVALETATSAGLGLDSKSDLLQALERAQRLGAAVTRISTGSHTSSALVSALVHRAQSERASTLLIGRRSRPSGLGDRGTSPSEFVDAIAPLLPGVTVHLVCPPELTSLSHRPGSRFQTDGQVLRSSIQVTLALGAATLVGIGLEQHLDPANVVMVFLAGVVYVASRAGRGPALATVAGSIFLYDLIFVEPRWSLKPTEPQYWLAFLVMLVVGLIISQLAARSREQAVLAEARAQRTQTLNRLSVALGRARDPDAVARALCDSVQAAVGSEARLLWVDGPERALRWSEDMLQGFDRHWAQQALSQGSETGHGTTVGSDQPLRYIPLMVGGSAFGLLTLVPPSATRDTLEDQHLLRSLANQAAVALERADLEARSVRAAVEAEGERTRNTLLAGVSHDFRTPLTTIVGNATLLIEQAGAIDDESRLALLRSLLGEACRLNRMTSNLLDLTRMDEGAIKLRPEWCPADELLESALAPMTTQLALHRFDVSVPPEALVWCDARLIDQVLVNLLDNAVRYTPQGGLIRIAVEVGSTSWSLSVHDDGPGITPGHEQALFGRFYTAGDNGDSSGRGLGLAICAAIAALHGGDIVAANQGGARFTLRLPQPSLPSLEAH